MSDVWLERATFHALVPGTETRFDRAYVFDQAKSQRAPRSARHAFAELRKSGMFVVNTAAPTT